MKHIAEDVTVSLSFGSYARARITRHFSAMLRNKIRDRGFDADNGDLFDQAYIEAESYRLAEDTIRSVGQTFEDTYNVTIMGGPPGLFEREIARLVREKLAETEKEYMADDSLGGLDSLINIASTAPLTESE